MPLSRPQSSRYANLGIQWIVLLGCAGAVLRGLWLAWQPLWWDEGYSFYFATEPISRMVALTAEDIHPPFYYLLLHGWLGGVADPIRGRLFSVVVGVLTIPLFAALTHQLYPRRRRALVIATLFLTLNPLHLFYSQEVRMYGLALSLGIGTSFFLLRAVRQLQDHKNASLAIALYCATALLSLHTLYYLGFLLFAHALWAFWQLRQQRQALYQMVIAWLAIALGYLPWLLYAGLKLTNYIKHKVASDKDIPLSLFDYLSRHLLAFLVGHRNPEAQLTTPEFWMAVLLLLLLVGFTIVFIAVQPRGMTKKRSPKQPSLKETSSSNLSLVSTQNAPGAISFLWACLLIPSLCAFIVNQFSPFFPTNGERLLLFVLPYFLLLLTVAIDRAYQQLPIRLIFVALLTLNLLGIGTFLTTARYADDDYRPLLAQIVEQSTASDTFLATYPWQIGFWRAYVHNPPAENAQPLLLSEGSVVWGAKVANVIDGTLQRGTLWFPALLSIGSTLPQDVTNYLQQAGAVSVSERWYSKTTRLDGWRRTHDLQLNEQKIDFGALTITAAAFAPSEVASANQPLDVTLRWTIADPNRPLNLSLRLLDEAETIWLQRDYRLASHWRADALGFVETIGMIVPPGLPPAQYRLVVGASYAEDGPSLTTRLPDGSVQPFALLGTVSITAPHVPLSPEKLPIQRRLTAAPVLDGTTILGSRGATQPSLAGEQLTLWLFYQQQAIGQQPRNLFVSLLDKNGAGVAGWEGWPLSEYPISAWQPGTLVQMPVHFDIPATVKSGEYQLVTGFVETASGTKSQLVELGRVAILQRVANFDPLTPTYPLQPQPMLGSHVRFVGYDLNKNDKGTLLQLYWQVEQTLLPQHRIFVHFDAEDGTTLAQIDGEPMTVAGKAPTGSWLPGEWLITTHQLTGSDPNYAVIRVGLYDPVTNRRLPVSVAGEVIGDAVEIK